MRIQHNIAALNSHRQLGANNTAVGKNLEKLSSGYRINRAGDDAAGLAISEKMRAQIKGLETATKNANDGISLVQTAEGALTEVHSMLNRMVELATQSANGTYDNEVDRNNLQKEVESLKSEIDRIAESTNYNGINLLDGSIGGGVSGTGADATFTGAEVAKYEAASKEGADVKAFDFSDATKYVLDKKDTFSIDGQSVTIDWSKGEAKTVATAIGSDFSTTNMSDTFGEDTAKKLTDLFNNSLAENGLKGEVKVSYSAGKFTFASKNNGVESEFSFTGSDLAPTGTEVSLGAALFGSTKGEAVESKATQKYNGGAIAANSTFNMTINGVKVKADIGAAAIAKGDTMDAVATKLEKAIQDAADAYNTAMGGLTGGTKNPDSGLTGLTKADFTVEAKDGSFVVKYSGDVEGVEFDFSDMGDKEVASSLGLSSGSSSAGAGQGLRLQIGDSSDSFNKIAVSVNSMSTKSLKISDIDIATQKGASDAIDKIKSAINKVSSTRGDLGAIQNRLEHTINNLGVTTENMTASESRIRDVDMAKEMMDFTKNNILTQASQAMLAQANQLPQGVLQLLQ
ncbi:flagellin N-terminal helical domain-containing protein [Anaerotignum sp.]|uniref:flagellin N-terminal helical domain-containing protein n=1 Tax=Anaerotignum sp. TaxID=2039241 RepID=UPI00289D4005|nr:flagellin [Anaerotignum sp.]